MRFSPQFRARSPPSYVSWERAIIVAFCVICLHGMCTKNSVGYDILCFVEMDAFYVVCGKGIRYTLFYALLHLRKCETEYNPVFAKAGAKAERVSGW
jgi:hypothetical protein